MNDAAFEALVPRWMSTATLVAALLTIPSVLLDVVVGLPHWLDVVAQVLNWAVWAVFLVALVTALVRAPSPWSAIRANPMMVVIIVLTTPLAPAGLQMFRLLRLGALLGAAHHARRLFSSEGLLYAGLILAVVVVGGGAIFSAVERSAQHLSFESGVWWAIVTVTTVGYGDIVPHTEAGRAVAVVVMVTGIGTAALLVGAASQRFVAGGEDGADRPSLSDLHHEIRELRAELADLRGDPAARGKET